MNLGHIVGAEFAWLIPGLCLTAFVITLVFGKFLPGRGSYISIAAILGAFLLFCSVFLDFVSNGLTPVSVDIQWIYIGNLGITWGFQVDRISVVMLGLVTLISLIVQVYSVGYMDGEPRFGWYFTLQALFAAAMLVLVLADNLLFLYIAWELVGLGSYLLIGFWYERRSASEAAKKAFITTRIGDVGLLIGIILLFKATGTFHISSIIHAANSGGISENTLICASLLIFLGAMGKSAQFPFHVWLPDAMEGPTPVSALIHAATMVVAGVYLVARMLPLFEMAPGVLPTVAVVGLFTFLFAGSIALVMTDIKRVLAYSTVSHLGLMMISLGAAGLAAAMIHLVAHGVSKALLFLGAGNVMHGMNNETNCLNMGGLQKKMPITAYSFMIGALSLAGIAPLAGFFSKDEILLAVFHKMGPIFLTLTLIGVFLSSLYMARLFLIVFRGNYRTERAKKAEESPAIMTVPVVVLAIFAVTLGAVVIPIANYQGLGTFIDASHHFRMLSWLTVMSSLIAICGVAVGWLYYGTSRLSPEKMSLRLGAFYRVIINKYYVDEIYQWVIDNLILAFSKFLAVFDRVVVNDTGIDGAGMSVLLSAIKVRLIHTGRLYNYSTAMVLGLLTVAIFWWFI